MMPHAYIHVAAASTPQVSVFICISGDSGNRYLLQATRDGSDTCTCESFRHHPHRWCKHLFGLAGFLSTVVPSRGPLPSRAGAPWRATQATGAARVSPFHRIEERERADAARPRELTPAEQARLDLLLSER